MHFIKNSQLTPISYYRPIPVEATVSTSIVCPNHYSEYFNENGVSLSLLCSDSDTS